jgi:hypothetical protein
MISTAARYQILMSNPARTQSTIENDVVVKRETDYYTSKIKTIKTMDEFLKDQRLFSYAMKAHGLSDMTYAKAFMKKMLNEGISDPKSMANKMTNPLYKEFAKAFDFKGLGDKATSQAGATTDTVGKYYRQTLETKEGEQNEGVRLALYFKRKASSITSAYGLLADKAILKFVQTTFNIPAESSKADIDAQARNLTKLVKIEDFKDPKKVEKLIQRFSAMYDMKYTALSASNPVLSLFGDTSEPAVGLDLMMSIATLRRGGF